MKSLLFKILFLTLIFQACKQNHTQTAELSVSFDTLIAHFKQFKHSSGDTFKFPVIDSNKFYKVEISNNPLPLKLKEVNYEFPKSEYLVSYSVIYKNRLINLCGSGSFICLTIPDMRRDYNFESILNTQKFEYHWILDNKLLALSQGKYYFLNLSNLWEEYKDPVPFGKQPLLFEDEKYIVFSSCFGEFGGFVYFYNKISKEIHYSEAVWAESVYKYAGEYYLFISTLNFYGSTSTLLRISNPDSLPILKKNLINKNFSWSLEDKQKMYQNEKQVFRNIGISFITSFIYQNRFVNLVNWRNETFLAEAENRFVKIINPFINSGTNDGNYVYDQITSHYNNELLLNLRRHINEPNSKSEIYHIIFEDSLIIKLNWVNKQ